MSGARLVEVIHGQSFLEDAFVRWVLAAAVTGDIAPCVIGQHPVTVEDRRYLLDFVVIGSHLRVAVELDGFIYHRSKAAFVYDRMRQNDLMGVGYVVLRFSYDAIRDHTVRCVAQLQSILCRDPTLASFLIADPIVPVAHDMVASPLRLATPPPPPDPVPIDYFDGVRQRMDLRPLRDCQREAVAALANYYRRGGIDAACVMSVGAGKTVLGVAASLAFTRRRALIVTPGRVIRGTFATALDPATAGNVLYTLRGGPLIAGCRPPRVIVLDSADGPIRSVSRDALLSAELIVTNFHSLSGTAANAGMLQPR